ncbi:uncharacterized protein SOCEGT47_019360 [Sorangium cellulosum]|uniref:Methyltransferase FkbM domain-containing protein n=1 Tax=Sorangium cellulosum TaxID=56 RepID=A0A3S7UWD2_SORCE|nr:FkbM family methyltransferase [Sorangium cellulosum]AUX21452.1 uncharacterized protein SOCEGT47_019360 [Sorangium cellulosum]AYM53065.1 hypothetical protein [Sorangium cellulosum]
MAAQGCAIVEFDDKVTVFRVTNALDYIQRPLCAGRFYEAHQLIVHANFIYRNCVVLDVGANIGNHTLFYAMHTGARLIYPFEPNPVARAVFEENLGSNDVGARVDSRYLRNAVGAERSVVFIGGIPDNNLGATQVVSRPSEAGSAGAEPVDCVRLDDLEFDGRVGFMKIDVEGMEMDVLDGARELIERDRPTIAMEVDRANEHAFWSWVAGVNYHVVHAFFDYHVNKNYIVIPKS